MSKWYIDVCADKQATPEAKLTLLSYSDFLFFFTGSRTLCVLYHDILKKLATDLFENILVSDGYLTT